MMNRGCACLVVSLALIGLWATPASACPGCQNPNLPMTRSSGVLLEAGGVRLGVQGGVSALEVTHESGCRDLNGCDAIPPQPLHYHEQVLIPAQIAGTLEWGLTDKWGVEVELPIRAISASVEYSTPDGEPYQPVEGNIHHRNEVLTGIGDGVVTLRRGWVLGDGWWVIGRLGASVPLGRTEPDPFLAGDNLKEHQHVQFGTGTIDPVVGAEVARSFGRLQGALYGQLRSALYANKHGFQAGSRGMAGLQAGYRFAERAVSLVVLEYMRDAPERWAGEIAQDGILGREEVLFGAAVGFSLGGPQYTLVARTPVFRRIFVGPDTEEGDIRAPLTLGLSVKWSM